MGNRRLTRTLAAALTMAWLILASGVGYADDRRDTQSCLPGVTEALREHRLYRQLRAELVDHRRTLRELLDAVEDQATYAALLEEAEEVAGGVRNGRLVVTLPDGTVVLDTAAENDPNNMLPSGNSFQHFRNKTVSENHNTRVAIMSAQQYPCGIGVERKLSTTTGEVQSYVALRLGPHLDSSGTARLSVTISE